MTTIVPNIELAPGYSISRLIKGGWQIAQGHAASAIEAQQAINDMVAFAQAGITTFDCADIYTGVEERIGLFREEYKRTFGAEALEGLHCHTKFVPDLDKLTTIDKAYVEKIIDRSLKRLKADCLDLVQFHWWDYDIPRYVETAHYLRELQQSGKIRHLGVTNFDVPHLKEIIDSGVTIVSNQVQYSLLDHRPEHGMTEYCLGNNIRLLCYGVLAGGFLSDKYLGHEHPADFANRSLIKYDLIIKECGGWSNFQELLRALSAVAGKHQATISQVALAYVLAKPAVAAVIIGAHDAAHLESGKEACGIILDEADQAGIKAAISRIRGPEGDIYSLERAKDSSHASIMKYNLNSYEQ